MAECPFEFGDDGLPVNPMRDVNGKEVQMNTTAPPEIYVADEAELSVQIALKQTSVIQIFADSILPFVKDDVELTPAHGVQFREWYERMRVSVSVLGTALEAQRKRKDASV